MTFLLRLGLYLLLSLPFGLVSWLFVDFTQRLAYSLPFWRIPDPANLLPTLFGMSAVLPWILAAAGIAAIEANQSRSFVRTAIATAAFWGGALVFSTGTSFLTSGYGPFARFGPDGLPHQIVRFLPDWLGPSSMFGHHAMSVPGFWHLQQLIVPMFMIGLVTALILVVGLVFLMVQRRAMA
jgi:hypothetical protein